MKRFLWKIAGADCAILEKSGKDSQYSFWLIGLMYLLINLLTYLGFYGMFWGVFDKILPSLLGTSVLGFLITTTYRLNLISLEPHTLPVRDEDHSLIFTNIIRYATVILFAFFVSKSVEMVLVNVFESAGFIDYDGSKGYMNHMTEMNKTQPWLWLITLSIIGVFIAPIYLRHRLNRAHEYYILRRISDKAIVNSEYQKFLQIKEQLLQKEYQKYSKLQQRFFNEPSAPFYKRKDLPKNIVKINEILQKRRFKKHPKRYTDEPFNTKEIKIERNLKSSEDFLEAILIKS
jgi:hypothetical protein